MTTPLSVLSGVAWQIQYQINVTHKKIVLQLYPETNLDTPIGEHNVAAIANKSALDGSKLTHKQKLVVFAKMGLVLWAQGPLTNWQRVLNRSWMNFQANVMVLGFYDFSRVTLVNRYSHKAAYIQLFCTVGMVQCH
jgi:hypothetical protein